MEDRLTSRRRISGNNINTSSNNLINNELLIQERETKEIKDILSVEGYVDLNSLREASKSLIIPNLLRGDVWKYFLGVSRSDKSEEVFWAKQLLLEYNDLLNFDLYQDIDIKIISKDIYFTDKEIQNKFEAIIFTYLRHHGTRKYSSRLISFLGPFIFSLKIEADIYHCFNTFINSYEYYIESSNLKLMLANFLMLFRYFHADLFSHFEDEELMANDWALPWLQNLLSRELPLPCLLRLWDNYLAGGDGFNLHPYVCLAILQASKEDLFELEFSGLKGYLHNLPSLDIYLLIMQARAIYQEVQTMKLL